MLTRDQFYLPPTRLSISGTRHRASTSMYSLTFCVRVVARTLPVEARSTGRRSNVENAPRHPPVTGQQRAHTPPSVRTMSSYRGMDAL